MAFSSNYQVFHLISLAIIKWNNDNFMIPIFDHNNQMIIVSSNMAVANLPWIVLTEFDGLPWAGALG